VFLDFIAPWILEAWADALHALAVELPQVDASREVTAVVIAGTAAGLLLLAMAGLRGLPGRARLGASLLLAPLLLGPAAFVTNERYGDDISREVRRLADAAWRAAQPATERGGGAPGRLAKATLPPPAPSVTVAEPEPKRERKAPEVAVVTVVPPPPPVVAAEQPSTAEIAAATVRRLSAPLLRKAPWRQDGFRGERESI
jgi:hypothetical protein